MSNLLNELPSSTFPHSVSFLLFLEIDPTVNPTKPNAWQTTNWYSAV
jgi:hypothetical protein